MEHYITLGELAMLLAVFWLPVFAVAAVPQWFLLRGRRRRVTWLLAVVMLECVMAFADWRSPLHPYFLSLFFLGGWAIAAIPLQAAVVSAVAATVLTGVARLRTSRPTH